MIRAHTLNFFSDWCAKIKELRKTNKSCLSGVLKVYPPAKNFFCCLAGCMHMSPKVSLVYLLRFSGNMKVIIF